MLDIHRPKHIRSYPARHILEYNEARGSFFSDLAQWLATAERGG